MHHNFVVVDFTFESVMWIAKEVVNVCSKKPRLAVERCHCAADDWKAKAVQNSGDLRLHWNSRDRSSHKNVGSGKL